LNGFGFNDETSFSNSVGIAHPTQVERSRVRAVSKGASPAIITRRPTLLPNEAIFMAPFNSEIERARTYLYGYHRQWFADVAAFMGNSGVGAEALARLARSRGVQAQTPDHRINHQSNLIGGNVRRLIGYLARSNSDPEIVPGDADDPFQVDAAKGARKFLDWQFAYDQYKSKELDVLYWSVICGMGVTEALWDPFGGPLESASDDETGLPFKFENGLPMTDKRGRVRRFSNGVAHTVVPPAFHYIYNIGARTSEEMSWNGFRSWVSFRQLESLMPSVVKSMGLVAEPQFTTAESIYERQVMMTMGGASHGAVSSPESGEPGAIVTKLYVAPRFLPREVFGDDLYETGAFMMSAQGRLLPTRGTSRIETNPFMEVDGVNPRLDWNPITIWPCGDVPGRMIGQGVVEPQIPVVDARNQVVSRIREAQRMTGQPKVLIPKNTTQVRINNEAGQQIPFNPAIGPPSFLQPTAMPAYIFQILEKLDSDLERIASQPPMMQGRAQGQVRSGLGVQLLQEQALTEFTPLLLRIEQARTRHWRQLLLREIQFGDAARKIVEKSGSGDWKQTTFLAKRLNPDFTIRIIPGTSMPTSKALVLSEIDRLIAWGVLQPAMVPEHAQVIARAMQVEVPQYTPDDQEQAINRARYENELMRTRPGEVIAAMASENHPVHINEHLRDLHSPRVMAIVDREKKMFGFSPTLGRYYHHVGEHQGMQQLRMSGVLIPQPTIPFEDIQGELAAQQNAGGGASGGGRGINQQVGAQGMSSRGAPPATDQMRNNQQHASVGPRATTVEPGGDERGAPSMGAEA
jgi:hypothetical protein